MAYEVIAKRGDDYVFFTYTAESKIDLVEELQDKGFTVEYCEA